MKASIRSIRILLFLSLFISAAWAAQPLQTVTVYKSPSCGCCEKWVEHMRASGFEVITHDTNNVAEQKTRLSVPQAMSSCHTAEVGGYVVEGHVPATDVKHLLADKPHIRGLAVPGMPVSAPGMDNPGKVPYVVYAIKNNGAIASYARY